MHLHEPIELAYRTTVEERRQGTWGRLMTALADYPVLGGLICGALAVAVAALRSFDGVAAEPLIAAGISLVVIFAWAGLFFLMRGFFRGQSFGHRAVLRVIHFDGERATWSQDGVLTKAVEQAQVQVLTKPVPDSESMAKVWPVFVVLSSRDGGGDVVVLETREPLTRARGYEVAPEALRESVDERLPRAAALPFLQALGQSARTVTPE